MPPRKLSFEVGVSTVDRNPQYVHQTLDGMLRADEEASKLPIRLAVCGRSSEYLGSWAAHRNVHVELMSADEWAVAASRPNEARCLLNFRRVLGNGAGALLAIEDDVVFAQGWVGKLRAAIDKVEEDFDRHPSKRRPYVLALYAAYKFKGRVVAPYKSLRFYGNQALFFAADARKAVRTHIDIELGARRPVPADMMVRKAAEQGRIALFVVLPNLCQHVGERSSLRLHFHKSPTFRP